MCVSSWIFTFSVKNQKEVEEEILKENYKEPKVLTKVRNNVVEKKGIHSLLSCYMIRGPWQDSLPFYLILFSDSDGSFPSDSSSP